MSGWIESCPECGRSEDLPDLSRIESTLEACRSLAVDEPLGLAADIDDALQTLRDFRMKGYV